MIRINILLLAFLCWGKLFAHPLHVNITNIDITNDSVKLVILIKAHGLENALELSDELSYNYVNKYEHTNYIIAQYVLNNLKVSINDNDVIIKDIHFKMKEDVVEVRGRARIEYIPEHLSIVNTLLVDNVSDARNLVIINANNVEQGFELTSFETKKTITLAK